MKWLRFGLDWRGLVLFLLVMAPNVLWFLVPAPVDVLRLPSKTPGVDMAASVAQVLMVGCLCLLHGSSGLTGRFQLLIAGALVGYWLCWGCYYLGITRPGLLLAMCLLPCASLLLYAFARRNWPALGFGGMFAVLHVLYGVVNFLC